MTDTLDRRGVVQGMAAAAAAALLPRDAAARPRRAPALFVSHGSPMVALDAGPYRDALRTVGGALAGGAARALVVVSAHWETAGGVRVTAAERPPLVYDFGGFPDALYRLRWEASGAPALARDVAERLVRAGLAPSVQAALEPVRGLDHGTWVPLRLALPGAPLPVVQVSLPRGTDAVGAWALGEALAPLRDAGVAVVGSGGLVHNLRVLDWHDVEAAPAAWAQAFDAWVAERLRAGDFAAVRAWERAPHAALAHPTPEHLMPLLVALGAARPGDRHVPVFEGFHHATLSMRCFALSDGGRVVG